MSGNNDTRLEDENNGEKVKCYQVPMLKIAHQRLSVLQLAEMLGNVSEACRCSGMDRTSFYEWKRRERHLTEGLLLTPEQVRQIEKYTPCFRERHVESGWPGKLLVQDTFFVRTIKGVGKVYMHAVVDTYGSFAFGFLHTSKAPDAP